MSKSISELDNNVSIMLKLVLACIIILLCSFFFFFVALNIVLRTPIHAVNTNVNDAPAIPTGIPTTVACEAMLKLPNYADNTMNTLSA